MDETSDRDLLLGFVGDVLVDREAPEEPFVPVMQSLRSCDLLFGNSECAYSDRKTYAPSASVVAVSPPGNVRGLQAAGFDVMSIANNHILDAGHEGLTETVAVLERHGIVAVGAGPNLQVAHQGAVVDVAGMSVGVQAYASFFPAGYEARPGWPGLAAVRAHNVYLDRLTNMWAPGAQPTCMTVPVSEDVDRLRADLERARAECDVLVASFHWGDYQRPFALTDHEIRTAHLAVDAGADIVIGHHHHMLRGIEWYRERPIFYGLGHFVFDLPAPVDGPEWLAPEQPIDPDHDDFYGMAPRPGWPLHPWHPDARKTMLALVQVRDRQVVGAGFLPCMLNPAGEVLPLDADSDDGRAVVDYVRQACVAAKLPVIVTTEGSPVLDGRRSAAVVPAGGEPA